MRIEIWSDVVCPWCYIGKRRLEQALASFPHADQVDLVYRSYQLDPAAPRRGVEGVADMLGRRYGGGQRAGRVMIGRSVLAAAEVGLEFAYADAVHASTRDAHRLLHLALEESGPEAQGRLKEALLAAYFTRGADLGDPDVLREVAVGAGLEAGRVEEVLVGTAYDDAVDADIEQAHAYGATGVPFFVVDGRIGIPGAQPEDVFRRVLDQAWATREPAVELVAGGEVCGPDGCVNPEPVR